MKKSTGQRLEHSRLTTTKPIGNVKKTTISINEEHLKRNLKLLGVTHDKFEKETKTAFQN
jgi:hypothetical protein